MGLHGLTPYQVRHIHEILDVEPMIPEDLLGILLRQDETKKYFDHYASRKVGADTVRRLIKRHLLPDGHADETENGYTLGRNDPCR